MKSLLIPVLLLTLSLPALAQNNQGQNNNNQGQNCVRPDWRRREAGLEPAHGHRRHGARAQLNKKRFLPTRASGAASRNRLSVRA
jgi:hypothetical protein